MANIPGGGDWPPCPFWDFAVALYGRAPAREACLALQDRHRLDVNFLLFCCWADRPLQAADFKRMTEASAPWRAAVVEPLRGVRGRLSTAGGPEQALRTAVLALEIDAEHIEVLALADALPDAREHAAGPTEALMRENLSQLLQFWVIETNRQDETLIDRLVAEAVA